MQIAQRHQIRIISAWNMTLIPIKSPSVSRVRLDSSYAQNLISVSGAESLESFALPRTKKVHGNVNNFFAGNLPTNRRQLPYFWLMLARMYSMPWLKPWRKGQIQLTRENRENPPKSHGKPGKVQLMRISDGKFDNKGKYSCQKNNSI